MADAFDTVKLGAFEVHRLGFGTMQLTGAGVWGPPADRAGAIQVLRRAVDLGVDLIDTADSYGPDVAEELIREALHPYPQDLVIATKAGFTRPGPDQWEECGRPEYLKRQCEGSLQRLGVDHIDLFQLHRVDPRVPADDQFGALKELRDAGQVAEVGLSEVGVADIEAARRIVPVATVQNQYNIAQRGADDVIDYCEQHAIGFIPWFPLGSGKLARERWPSRRRRPPGGRHRVPGVPGLAAPSLPGHAAHPGHIVGRPPRGERCSRQDLALRRAVRDVGRRPEAPAPMGPGRLRMSDRPHVTLIWSSATGRWPTAPAARYGGPTSPSPDDRIIEVGERLARGRRELDAEGLLVTPGFVDPHTHYDGQATWDPQLAPSSHHGVTTRGHGQLRCGLRPRRSPTATTGSIATMEGVEDIPGTALHEGLQWDWESFPEYLDALERQPRTIDVGTHVPHAALRALSWASGGPTSTSTPIERNSRPWPTSSARGSTPERSA